jgi:hypothetical protein
MVFLKYLLTPPSTLNATSIVPLYVKVVPVSPIEKLVLPDVNVIA